MDQLDRALEASVVGAVVEPGAPPGRVGEWDKGAPVEVKALAHALVQRGIALRVAGRRGDARDPLRRGLDLADRCGADALAARAREQADAIGARALRRTLEASA